MPNPLTIVPALRAHQSVLIIMALSFLPWASVASAAPTADAWDYWDVADETSTRAIDHSAWQSLLDTRLETLAEGRTIVHYDAFNADDRQRLNSYLRSLTAIDPRALSRQEQFAYWINLYNALTVDLMLEHPDKQSILRIGGGFLPSGPWDDDITRIAGKTLTLNDIEHRILRPIFQDQRIHYAVNCASIGCPNLAASAYTAANLEELLAAGERAYLGHPRGLSLKDGRLTVSSIFKWYRDDFASDAAGLLEYFAGVRTDLASDLRTYQGKIRYAYDWDRNDR